MLEPAFLKKNQAEVIHNATLKVLEKTGIKLDHKKAEKLLLENGAIKDKEGRILIPRKLVEEILAKAKNGFTIFNRKGIPALEVKNGNTYFGTGSDALYQRDEETGEIRESSLQDIVKNVQLADALGFDFIMSMALPREIEHKKLYPVIFAEMIRNTSRPVIITAVKAEDIFHINQIAKLATANKSESQPLFIAYLEPMSPLIFDKGAVEKLFYCAENKIPLVFAAGSNCGIGSPITLEGGLVQGNAETLAGLVIAMLVNKNVSFVYGTNTSTADMRSGMVCYGSPGWSRTSSMYADMGKFYNLPTWGTAGCTDAVDLDAQAAWEAYRGILLAVQSGSTIVHDVGYMALGELYDRRMLVLTAEMIREAKQLMKPVDLSAEALSIEVIDEVARKSSLFLAHPHTRNNYRKSLFISKIINRDKAGGVSGDIFEKTDQYKSRILSKHKPELLEDKIDQKIQEYLDSI